jgi:hypothetical protein
MFREMMPAQSSEETPQPLSKEQPGAMGSYTELSQMERENHAKKEMTDVEIEIARLEARASEINKSLPKKFLATIDREGRDITEKLNELYGKRNQLNSRHLQ